MEDENIQFQAMLEKVILTLIQEHMLNKEIRITGRPTNPTERNRFLTESAEPLFAQGA